MNDLYSDDAVDMLEEMPANVVKKVLAATDKETRRDINSLLKYPEDSAGSIMTVEYVDLRAYMSVSDAIDRIRQTGVDKETINTGWAMWGLKRNLPFYFINIASGMPAGHILKKACGHSLFSYQCIRRQGLAAP